MRLVGTGELVVAAPGVECERVFTAVGGRRPRPDDVMAVAARHGITVVAPPA